MRAWEGKLHPGEAEKLEYIFERYDLTDQEFRNLCGLHGGYATGNCQIEQQICELRGIEFDGIEYSRKEIV